MTGGHPERVAAAKVAGAAASSLVAPLLAALSAMLFGSRTIAIGTGLAAAVHPSFILVSADIQSETIFLPLLLGAGCLLLAATDRPSTSLALGAGALLAAAALVRPTALALAPFALAPLCDRRYPLRARAHLSGAAVLGLAAALAPWTVRNALMFHELIPVSDSWGSTFFEGNTEWTQRLYEARSRGEFEKLVLDAHRDKQARLEALGPAASQSPGRRSSALARLALEERLGDPAGTARLYARKIWQWIRPYPTPLYWPAAVLAGVGLLYTALYAAAAVGLARARRRGAALFSLAVLAVTMVSHVLVLVLWRYRVPSWDPILLLYGVFGAGSKLPAWKQFS